MADAYDDIEAELRRLEESLGSALALGNVEAISSLLAPDYVFTRGSGERWGRAHAMADVSNPGYRVEHLAVDVETVEARREEAIVTGLSRVRGHIGSRSISGTFRFIHEWRRSDGGWQLVVSRTSR